MVEFRPDWAEQYFFCPISAELWPGNSVAFLLEAVFFIDRPSCLARTTGRLSRRVSEKNIQRSRVNRKPYNVTWGLGTNTRWGQTTLKSVIWGKFALFTHFLTKLCTLPWLGVLIIFTVKNVKISYCDVIFDDVTKTWYTNFLISNHQIHHLKEHD